MARPTFRFPVWRRLIGREEARELLLPLKVCNRTENFVSLVFRFDTATDFTTIPIATAESFAIPFDRGRRVTVHGTTGIGHGFLAPIRFSLAALSGYEFESLCCFTPTSLSRPLLSLKDVIDNFRMRTLLPSHLHPLGSLVLQLHSRHKGQPRSA